MKKNILNTKYKIQNTQNGFTLIELIVAIFIFSLITVAIVSVFVSTVTAYGKARAIKTVKENAEYALGLIAKDVRMGKIESTDPDCAGSDASKKSCLMFTRNLSGGKVCYRIAGSYLGVQRGVSGDTCSLLEGNYIKIINLSNAGMTFDTSTSGFYSLPTDMETAVTPEQRRGWVEINLNIIPTSGISNIDMSTDAINVQTIVSSRDYGWEEIQ